MCCKIEIVPINLLFFILAPTHPRDVKVKAFKEDELLVTWKAPSKPNGNVTHYYVYWQPQPLSRDKLDQRDYCKDSTCLISNFKMLR